MTVLLRRLSALILPALVVAVNPFIVGRAFAQSGTPAAPERIVSPVRSDLPGRTVWAFATTGTGTAVTTFAATDKGLFRSSGTTWTETTLRNQAVYAVKSRRIGNTVTLLAGTDRGVQRSVDNGATWQSVEVTTGSVGGTALGSTSNVLSIRKVFDIEIIQPGNGNGNGNSAIWFAATEKGVFRSNNDGRSWTLVNIDRTVDNNEVRGITTDGNTIIVNLWREGLWRSTNNGNSWSRLTIAGETALCRAVHAHTATNGTVWLAGSVAGNIWRSVNNGSSWTRVYQTASTSRSISSSALAQTGIDAIVGNGRTVFAATPGGIAYSRSYGQTWMHTRTTTPQAVSLALHGSSLHVGLEKQSSLVADKYSGSQLTSGDDSYGVFCTATQLDYNPYMDGIESCGGGGSSGGSGGGIIPPNPSITSITPSPSVQSSTPVTITINGTNLSSAYVQVRIYPPPALGQWQFLQITSVSSSQIVARVPASLANTVGSYGIQVVHGPAVDITDETPKSQEFPWTVAAPQIPLPVLNSIQTVPTPLQINQAATLTLNGSDFAANAQVWLRGPDGSPTQLQRTAPSSATLLTATLPALAASGTFRVYVVNPGNSTFSQERSFTVSNPQAAVSGVTTSPSSVVAGQTFTVTVNGSNFLTGTSLVSVSGPSGTVNVSPTISASQISFSFTPPQSGTYTVSVQNPGTNSATGQFTVQSAPLLPQATSLTQNGQPLTNIAIASGGQGVAQTITVNGSNFDAQTSFVRLMDGSTTTDLTPSSRTASALTVTIPATALQTALKTLSLSVVTPPFSGTAIGGGTSAALPLHVVLPQPVLRSFNPASIAAGSPQNNFTLQGDSIFPGQTQVRWSAGRDTVWANVAVGNTASIPASALQYPTAATIHLVNPRWQNLGGGVSMSSKEVLVQNTTPRLDSIGSRVYAWFGVETSVPLLIYGDFSPTTAFRFQTPSTQGGSTIAELRPTPQNFSPSRVQVDVPFALIGLQPPGFTTIRAVNKALSSSDTDLLSVRTDTFRVVNPAPRIFNAAPEFSMTTLPQQITLSGEAFLMGVSASIGGVNAPVQRNSANQIIVSFDAAVLARLQSLGAGVHHLIVRNPAPALAEASLPITLTNPAIITLTVQPNPHTLTAPPSAQTVTLTALGGTPYIATNATVSFRGQTFPIASRPAQDRVTTLIPASLLGEAGNYPITVNQPAVQNASGQSVGASSQQAAWVLNNPRPVVNAMTTSPNPAQTGADATLTIDGSAFVPLAKIVVRGGEYTPSSNTGTRLTVTIPASALDSAGTFPVVVRNPQGGGDAVNQPTLTVLAPRPRLTLMAPPSSVRSLSNQQALTLSLAGSGFVRGSRVVWGVGVTNTPLAATYSNANQLSVSVPANLLTQAGTFRLVVVNDALAGQGGGTSDTLTFTLQNPTASLFNVNPTLLPRFAASAALTLTGDNFVQGARVLVTGLNNVVDTLTTQVLSPTEAQTTLPASLLDSAATLQIRVLNPAPVPSASGVAQASVVNPRPRLSSMNPTQTLTGLPSLTVNVQGTNFMDGVTGFANGLPVPTNRQNDNNAVLTLPASVLAQAGTVVITLQNPTPRVQPEFSDSLSLIVNNPLPRLDSAVAIGALGMSTLVVSTQATTVTLFGDSFILASQVKENGASTSSGSRMESTLSSSRLSLNQITTVVPSGMTAEAGTVRLTVENPTPGGGRSQPIVMNVLHPVPLAERITPSVVVIPTSDLSITITGDRFVNTAEVLVNGAPVTVQSRTATRITASIPAAMLASRGFYTVTVRNPMTNAPMTNDGGTSDALTLRVNTPQPLLTTLSPAQIPLDTVDIPITITGSRFLPEAIVRITTPDGVNATLATTSLTATEIRATLPASLVNRGGIYSLRVENPAPTDAVSAPLTFALVNPVPQMDSITPKVVVGNANPQTITVFGQKFTPTSVVRWRGQDLATTFVSRTNLTAIIPPAQQVRGAVGAVTVFTPTDGVVVGGMPVGGGTGSALGTAGVLTLTHGTPSLTSAAPAALLRDAWSANALPSLTMNGQLFASTATVRVRSSAGMNAVDTVLTPTSVSANAQSLTLTMPRAVMTTAGTFSLTVTNPRAFPAQPLSDDGGTSSAFNVTVQNPTPTLSSLAPASLAAASPNTLLTVNGANFTRETQLFVNGMPAERAIVSASQLTTTLPASLFTLSGFVRVQVLNPAPSVSSNNGTGSANGDSSNTLSLEVFNPVPTFTSVSPVFAPIGGRSAADSVTLTLVGTNFVRNSVARIAQTAVGSPTTDLPTTFVATTTLSVRLLAADWRAQAYNLTVLNPAPRGGVSVARRFTVTNPIPVLTALIPNSTIASGKAWTLRVVGNFFTSTSQISYNKALQSLANTTYIPNAQAPSNQDTLLVRLNAVPVGDTTFPVVVVNPPTGGVGGGASDTLRLAIGLPAPTITSLSPATTTATLGDRNRTWTLTINGTLFDDAAKVFVNGREVPTRFVSATRLTAIFPDSLQAVQARRTVQVRNTALLVSNLVPHIVQNPAPVLAAVEPSTVIAGRDTVLTLTGDRFAPDASVRLTFGATAIILTPSRRDSVMRIIIPLPASLIISRGAYTLAVTNPPLQPTMVRPDTVPLGGGTDNLPLTVLPDALHSVEYASLDTLIDAGGNLPAFTVRFRDRVLNLVDNDGAVVYYQDTSRTQSGYLPLTRTGLGTYRTTATRFMQSGVFGVWVDSAAYGPLAVVGANRFRVRPLADSIAVFAGLEQRPTVTAGDTLPSFIATVTDKLGNLTDNTTARFSYARSGGSSSATVSALRLSTGVYRISATRATIAGTYTYTLAGVPTVQGQRTVEVLPDSARQVEFVTVKEIVPSGTKQSAADITFRDRFGNTTDVLRPEQYALWYSNSTDATLTAAEAMTASEALTQRVSTQQATLGQPLRGLYRASATVVFAAAGKYSLSVAGITVTTGTTAFEVVPNVDTRVTVEGLRDTITAGEMLPAFTVRYFDASGNPTDNGVGRVMYSRSGGSSTATIVMVRSGEGVYAVSSTRATIAGNYLINVQGIPVANMTGNRDVLVRPDIPISAAVTLSTRAMTSAGARVNLSVTFRDQFGNGTDAPPQATLANQNILTSVATVNLAKTGTVGVFTTTAVVTQPGVYNVSFSVQRPAEQGGGTIGVPASTGTNPRFNINPGLALRATFFNVPLAWGLNEPLAAQNLYVRVTDTLGATTNVWDGNARVYGTPTTGMRDVSFIPRDQNFDLHSGLFDVEPTTAFAVAGRYTFSLFHKETVDVPQPGTIEIPFRSYAGNRTMDILAAPVLTSVSPTTTLASIAAWTLTVNGTGFTTNSRIVLNGTTQATTRFISATKLTLAMTIPSSATFRVQVTPNALSSIRSSEQTVSVQSPLTITGIQPPSIIATTMPVSLEIRGSGFTNQSQIFWNNVQIGMVFVSDNVITATIPTPFVEIGTIASVKVQTPFAAQFSTVATMFTVNNPAPTVTSNMPNYYMQLVDKPLEILGNGFVKSSKILLDGQEIPFTYIDGNKLKVEIVGQDPGLSQLVVQNPAPGGGATPILSLYLTELCGSHYHHNLVQTSVNNSLSTSSIAGKNKGAASLTSTTDEIIIPIVVHVLYLNDLQNRLINDAQIKDQIDFLNTSFRTIDQYVPQRFRDVAGSFTDPAGQKPNIRFCLASKDPNGNPTSGIQRKQTNSHHYPSQENSYTVEQASGLVAWDKSKYMNIWVVPGSDVLGAASFPGTGSNERTYYGGGIIMQFDGFGRLYWEDFFKSPTFDVVKESDDYKAFRRELQTSRAQTGHWLVHEVGHWLSLFHIWADKEFFRDGDEICGDDEVDDTPPQRIYASAAVRVGNDFPVFFPLFLRDNRIFLRTPCENSVPDRDKYLRDGNMWMNFMDYNNYSIMFTKGQVSRMLSAIQTSGVPRNSFLNADGHIPPTPTISNALIQIPVTSANLLTITGANFALPPNITATLNGQSISILTTGTSSFTQCTVNIPAALLQAPGVYPLRITNLSSISGGSFDRTVQRQVVVSPAAPTLSAVSPTSIEITATTAGSFEVTLAGANFITQGAYKTEVWFNNIRLDESAIVSRTATTIRVRIPASAISGIAAYSCSVINPPIIENGQNYGGGTASSQVLVVNPRPSIVQISPNYAILDDVQAQTSIRVTIDGENFTSESKIWLFVPDGQTSYTRNDISIHASIMSPNRIAVDIPSAMISTVNSYKIAVSNATLTVNATEYGGGSSSEFIFQVINPIAPLTPSITVLQPEARAAGSGNFLLTIRGEHFASNAIIRFDNQVFSPVLIRSSTRLTVEVNASWIATPNLYNVVVENPGNSSGPMQSASAQFAAFYPTPDITALDPISAAVDDLSSNYELTITGENFLPNSIITFDGQTLSTSNIVGMSDNTIVILPTSFVRRNSWKVEYYPVSISNPTLTANGNLYGGGISTRVWAVSPLQVQAATQAEGTTSNRALSGKTGNTSVSLSPNPATSALYLTITLQQAQSISARIIDQFGKSVLDVYHGEMGSGSHQITTSIAQLSSGVYTCQVFTASGLYSRQFTIIR